MRPPTEINHLFAMEDRESRATFTRPTLAWRLTTGWPLLAETRHELARNATQNRTAKIITHFSRPIAIRPVSGSRPSLSSPRILLVEDDFAMRALLLRALRENGFRASSVSNGREMWSQLENGPVDLIVLDVMLPGVSGLDLCRALRAKTHVPIIMVSARGDETDRVVGLELGADDYIAKPFGTRELLARVRAVLRRGSTLDGVPRTSQWRDRAF